MDTGIAVSGTAPGIDIVNGIIPGGIAGPETEEGIDGVNGVIDTGAVSLEKASDIGTSFIHATPCDTMGVEGTTPEYDAFPAILVAADRGLQAKLEYIIAGLE